MLSTSQFELAGVLYNTTVNLPSNVNEAKAVQIYIFLGGEQLCSCFSEPFTLVNEPFTLIA